MKKDPYRDYAVAMIALYIAAGKPSCSTLRTWKMAHIYPESIISDLNAVASVATMLENTKYGDENMRIALDVYGDGDLYSRKKHTSNVTRVAAIYGYSESTLHRKLADVLFAIARARGLTTEPFKENKNRHNRAETIKEDNCDKRV